MPETVVLYPSRNDDFFNVKTKLNVDFELNKFSVILFYS